MKKIKISVGDLVNFVYNSGNLVENANLSVQKQEGTIAHQFFQSSYNEESIKEYFVSINYSTEEFEFELSGRIDGLIKEDDKLIIDEIKSTRRNLEEIEDIIKKSHLCQAKLYGYMFLCKEREKNLSFTEIMLRITYIEIDTKKIKHFYYLESFIDLESFFIDTISRYLEFFRIFSKYQEEKLITIKDFKFPFSEFRQGQRELMVYVYDAILNNEMLYANAPTGIGKTAGTLFPSIKTIKSEADKIFYLTAKSSLKETVQKTLILFNSKGLNLKAIFITSKEKICFLEEKDCENCPFALGYYDRLYHGIIDIYQNVVIFDADAIKKYAEKHTLCPFEYSLDISNYVDIIVGDYNYAFCPRTHLVRYFDERSNDNILLIDEAHNLVSRSKDMYSAEFKLSNLKDFKQCLSTKENKIIDLFIKLISYLENQVEAITEINSYKELDFTLISVLRQILERMEIILFKQKKVDNHQLLLNNYYIFFNFIKISEFFNEKFVYLIEKKEDDFLFAINCLDSAEFILKTISEHCKSAIFFSATLLPLKYYQKTLSNNIGESLIIESPFPEKNFKLLNYNCLSTRYKDRKRNIVKLKEIIKSAIMINKGNYIAFFPSYEYLNQVYEDFSAMDYEIIVQKRETSNYEFNEIMDKFKETQRPKIGFFVMGGLFSEGIDYLGDLLKGVIIVGVGMPQMNYRNNLLREYYDSINQNGFDYAYLYPGINKVIQAAGRVIRSETDYGFALLVDDRFTERKYFECYPKNWHNLEIVNTKMELEESLKKFFSSYISN